MRIPGLAFVLLLGTSWLAAQTPAGPNQERTIRASNREGSQETVSGCLTRRNAEFMLTDRYGMSYKLSDNASKLAEYVGQQVQVIGVAVARSVTGRAQQTDGTGGSIETLRVNSIRHIENTCPSGEGEVPK